MDIKLAWTLVKSMAIYHIEDMEENAEYAENDKSDEEEIREYRKALSKVKQFMREKLKEEGYEP